MGDRRSLTAKVVEAMAVARREHNDPWDIQGEDRALALAAQKTSAEQVRAVAQGIQRLCVERRHRGSVPAREGSPEGAPCARCRAKVSAYREAADLVSPD